MSDEMIQSTLTRMSKDATAATLLKSAAAQIETAVLLNRNADIPDYGSGAQAFITESLEHLVRRQGYTLRDRALERARQLGWQVATYEIVPIARESGGEPVVFITDNSFMPPLRAFSISDTVWQATSDPNVMDLWSAYVEGLERALDEARVLMECPEYDNALYVVDLARFEHVEDGDSDTLSGDWTPIASD